MTENISRRSKPLPAADEASPAPRIGFAGTPEFAAVALRYLLTAGYRPEIVLTQPDRPAGRGRKLRASAVKELARSEGLTVAQPESLRKAGLVSELGLDQLDCLIVAAYGLLLPQAVLDAPRIGCINVHASLLPRWRGAAPIVWAIASGDEATGVCLMQMEAGLDTGPVFASQRTPIRRDETSVDLHNRLAQLGGNLLVQKLPELLAGRMTAQPQEDADATYARKLSREDGQIDWQRPATEIDARIRAFNPYPGCVASLYRKPLKCWESVLSEHQSDAQPGTVFLLDEHGMHVGCGDGAVCIGVVQRPGRGRIAAHELGSQSDLLGVVLGNGQ